ncbi:MAG: hypothetical protein J5803_00405 [Desulfovibrio sp.]|nr:hypothetical protein [Desulfovibrio sp.]
MLYPVSFPKKNHSLALLFLFFLLQGCSAISGSLESKLTGNVPYAAKTIAKALDEQLIMRYAGQGPERASVREALARSRFLIMGTTPVNLNTLTQSCPLARQMTEEISSNLMALGYRYEELRKGKDIRFDRTTGELNLTRSVRQLTNQYGKGQAILAGTYVMSDNNVRFSISLIHTLTNEVLAKASATVPITNDMFSLIDESPVYDPTRSSQSGNFRLPNTYTHLR